VVVTCLQIKNVIYRVPMAMVPSELNKNIWRYIFIDKQHVNKRKRGTRGNIGSDYKIKSLSNHQNKTRFSLLLYIPCQK